MKSLKNIRYLYLIATVAVVFLCIAGGTIAANKLFHLDNYKEQILSEAQKSLNRKVTYQKGTFSFNFGLSFTFSDVVIHEKSDSPDFITADNVTFRVALLPLLEKKIVFKEIILTRPVISLYRDKSGTFNVSDLIEGGKGQTPLHVKGIKVKKGRVQFTDMAAATETVSITLEETDLSLSHLGSGKTCQFKFSTHLLNKGKKEIVNLAGSAKLPEPGRRLSDTRINGTIVLKNLEAERYWPYYSRFVPFKKILGRLDLNASFNGTLAEFTSKGSARVRALRFDYPQVFHSVLTPHDLNFSYAMDLSRKTISVKDIALSMDGLKVKGRCSLHDIGSGDIRIVAHATTSKFRLEDFYRYIPYGIIVKEPSEFIENNIKGGVYKLDDGRLDGRISQIVHMEQGENYNVLAIRGTVEKGLVSYGSGVPAFTNIKGELELRGKDFLLHRMTGQFGASPFSLEGKIADYPLDSPSSYPFDMIITPRQSELSWLLGKDAGKKISFSGDSKLHLRGEGYTSGYNLAGEWNLTPATYSFPDFVDKPGGRQNLLSFKGSINKQEARLASLQYNLAPMSLDVSGGYRFTGQNHLAIEIRSNLFQLDEVAPLVPSIVKYHPGGKLKASLHGESSTGKKDDLGWGGYVSFTGFSFKPSQQIKPISNVNGTINFKGTKLETSQIAVKLGNSLISCKGSITGFTHPDITLAFSAPTLDMADLGLHAPQKEVKARNVQGNIVLKGNTLEIDSLSGQIGNSTAMIQGEVEDIHDPRIDITVTSSHLELADIVNLTQLERPGKKANAPHIALKAAIAADSGKVLDVGFENLRATVMLENGIVYLQPLELTALGGQISGKGRLDPGANDAPPRYQMSYSLNNVSVGGFLQIFGIRNHQITGSLSMQGELTAKGKTSAELKKTSLGSLKLRCTKGTLKKFAVLSKVFSILNVSQLLKFQLPDMVSGGMPYNEITANVAIRDGIISSQDLYIASNAMNISALGKIDMVKDEVDATIGVQPLQTVGKVVNRIPVVGWILTGKGKTFLTAYFEAKGRMEDPVVKAIPVKSMTKGVLNMFIRVFELPAKLVTDTGEVLIGK